MTENKYLTVNELATFLRRKPATIRKDLSKGLIPHKRILGTIVFDREEILAWIDEQNETPETEDLPASPSC